MRILAIDPGKARTGVAVCDATQTLATPVCVLPSRDPEALYAALERVIAEQKPEKLLIGRALRTDGAPGEMAQFAQQLADELTQRTGLEAELYDERFTTVIAAQRLHAAQKNAKKQKPLIDAAAAAVLLQSYIDGKE